MSNSTTKNPSIPQNSLNIDPSTLTDDIIFSYVAIGLFIVCFFTGFILAKTGIV